mgnify:FL=1
MMSLQHNALQFNTKFSFDFSGGNLSSDSGLLFIKEFIHKIGFDNLLKQYFGTDKRKIHSISSVIEQLIYQNIAGYHRDDAADHLRYDPVFKAVLEKEALASQPTISRTLNSFEQKDIDKFNDILEHLYKMTHKPSSKEHIILDLDSTNVKTHGHQDESTYIYHYGTTGYHPMVLYDGLTGDLMKFMLRKGSEYTSTGVVNFLEPVLISLQKAYPEAMILVRGDSGFAVPDLYDLCEKYGVHYLFKLKANATLHKLSSYEEELFLTRYKMDYSKYHCQYDDFFYQAKVWKKSRCVVTKIERSPGELVPRKSFIVTSLMLDNPDIFRVYNNRGNMENYIKETKLDFGLDHLSHSSFLANQAKAMILAVAYSLVNAMKQMVLPKEFSKSRMSTLRTVFIKIAGRSISHARKMKMRLCSSAPYKEAILKIFENIHLLALG